MAEAFHTFMIPFRHFSDETAIYLINVLNSGLLDYGICTFTLINYLNSSSTVRSSATVALPYHFLSFF